MENAHTPSIFDSDIQFHRDKNEQYEYIAYVADMSYIDSEVPPVFGLKIHCDGVHGQNAHTQIIFDSRRSIYFIKKIITKNTNIILVVIRPVP
jgi:hypothetical protein